MQNNPVCVGAARKFLNRHQLDGLLYIQTNDVLPQ